MTQWLLFIAFFVCCSDLNIQNIHVIQSHKLSFYDVILLAMKMVYYYINRHKQCRQQAELARWKWYSSNEYTPRKSISFVRIVRTKIEGFISTIIFNFIQLTQTDQGSDKNVSYTLLHADFVLISIIYVLYGTYEIVNSLKVMMILARLIKFLKYEIHDKSFASTDVLVLIRNKNGWSEPQMNEKWI